MLRFTGSSPKSKNPEELSVSQKLAVLLTGINNPRPVDTERPEQYGLQYEPRLIPVGSRVSLGAWLIPHERPIGSVLLFHGYTASKSTLLVEARAFHERGYAALVVDFRGSADSSETYTTVGYHEADDVRAAVDYAVRELGFAAPVVYARSMGAAAVLRSVAVHSLPVTALVLEGVFDEMLTTVKQRFYAMGVPAVPFAHLLVFWGGLQFGFWPFTHNPSAYAHRCSLPVLMLHGSRDPRATLEHANSVFNALAGAKRLCTFEGATHEQLALVDRVRWDSAVDQFLTTLIAKTPDAA